MALGAACPKCATGVPFIKTPWGLGRSFACAGCGESLVVPRSQAAAFGFGMVAIFLAAQDRFPQKWGGMLGLLVVMVMIGLPVTWAMTRARLAKYPS